jgi:hypothetical protein
LMRQAGSKRPTKRYRPSHVQASGITGCKRPDPALAYPGEHRRGKLAHGRREDRHYGMQTVAAGCCTSSTQARGREVAWIAPRKLRPYRWCVCLRGRRADRCNRQGWTGVRLRAPPKPQRSGVGQTRKFRWVE